MKTIKDNEVHIYLTKPEEVDPSLLSKYKKLLCQDEHKRHDRFKFQKLKTNFLITRALARTTLAEYLGCNPNDLTFGTNSYGKPSLEGISFNLSHTDGLIALGVMKNQLFGIDTENLDRKITEKNIAKRFFAEPEYQEIMECTGIERKLKFLQFWTLKEAYIKAVGKGMAIPLDKFYFKIIDDEIKIQTEEDSKNWQFQMFEFQKSHLISIASEGLEIPEVSRYQTIPMD
jgi:4'-phosphopantetheinyl transferase